MTREKKLLIRERIVKTFLCLGITLGAFASVALVGLGLWLLEVWFILIIAAAIVFYCAWEALD